MADDIIPDIDLREKLAHIDLMLQQHDRVRQEIGHADAQRARVLQEIRYQPWLAAISGMTAGAALFAAGAAFVKLMGG